MKVRPKAWLKKYNIIDNSKITKKKRGLLLYMATLEYANGQLSKRTFLQIIKEINNINIDRALS